MIGTTLGSYRITDRIGEGGMGAVYIAEHAMLHRPAAVKVLLPEFSRNQEIVKRFFNEARATSAIRHPGIVEIFDFGHEGDTAYIVMEYLDGECLTQRLERRRKLPAGEALGLIRQVAGALHAAHERGIVHRDLKPDNIIIVPDPDVAGGERTKLLDFGIAKLAGEIASPVKTRTGVVMGTPAYMAPEQCRGISGVDARADVYALGCILFEMLCGRRVFVVEATGDFLVAHISQQPPDPTAIDATIPAEISALIRAMLRKNPTDRLQSASEVIDWIDRGAGATPIASASSGFGTRVLAHPGCRSAMPAQLSTQPPAATAPGRPGDLPATDMPPPVAPTTLSSAATYKSQFGEPRSRPSKYLLAIVALVLCGVGGAGVAMWTGGDGGEGEPTVTSERVARPRDPGSGPAEREAVAPPAPVAQDRAPLAPPDAGPAVAEITIVIDSEPRGAWVYDGVASTRLGKTPYTRVMAPAEGELVFKLSKSDYHSQQVVIAANRSAEQLVVLDRKHPRAAHGDPGGRDSSSEATSAEPKGDLSGDDETRLNPFEIDKQKRERTRPRTGKKLDPFAKE